MKSQKKTKNTKWIQTFGDGEQLAILFNEENSKAQTAIRLNDYIAETVDVERPAKLFEPISFMGGSKDFILGRQGDVKVTLTFSVPADKFCIEYAENGGLMFNFDMFRNCTVRELFKAIDKKLKSREDID